MSWAVLIPIILEYGLPFAEALFQKAQSGGNVTQTDLDQLKLLATNTPQSQILAAAGRAGIPSTDPTVLRLLAMVPPNPS